MGQPEQQQGPPSTESQGADVLISYLNEHDDAKDTRHWAGQGTAVVNFPREIDMANAVRVGAELAAAFDAGAAIVVADMSGTRFCDTSGIHVLVMAHKRAKASNTRFRVVVRPGEVRQVLEIARLDTVLTLYPRLDIALLDGDQ